MVLCPQCGENIVSNADVCPHCNHRLAVSDSESIFPFWLGAIVKLIALISVLPISAIFYITFVLSVMSGSVLVLFVLGGAMVGFIGWVVLSCFRQGSPRPIVWFFAIAGVWLQIAIPRIWNLVFKLITHNPPYHV